MVSKCLIIWIYKDPLMSEYLQLIILSILGLLNSKYSLKITCIQLVNSFDIFGLAALDYRDSVRHTCTRVGFAVVLAMCWGTRKCLVLTHQTALCWQWSLTFFFPLLFVLLGCKWLWFRTCCIWLFYSSLYFVWRRNFCKSAAYRVTLI